MNYPFCLAYNFSLGPAVKHDCGVCFVIRGLVSSYSGPPGLFPSFEDAALESKGLSRRDGAFNSSLENESQPSLSS